MPNLIVRFARCLMRSRKRSNSTAGINAQNGANLPHENKVTTRSQSPKQSSRYIAPEVNEDEAKSKNDRKDCTRQHLDVRDTGKPTENKRTRDEGSSTSSKPVDNTRTTTYKIPNSNTQSTTVRSRRVLRELQLLTKASDQPNSPFEVSLIDDSNIFEWDVRLRRVDESSDLWRSMQDTGTESIRFRLSFPELFPFQPPFLRLDGPYLDNGFIMDGGAICMEVLTAQGWSSAYTIESLLVQVSSGLTQGGAVVSRRQKRRYNQLSQRRAEVEFRRICKIHAKYGWVSMEKDDL